MSSTTHKETLDPQLREAVKTGIALPLMEQFYTIQGEGAYQGEAAYFIRLGGCDVGCVWCDVKESWDATQHPIINVDDIVDKASQHPCRLAVITGGEPLMYNLEPLTEKLRHKGFQTHIETSGAHPITGRWNWICLSPKKFKFPLAETLPSADELKVVIYNKSDFDWAEKYAAEVRKNCQLFLQPEYSRLQSVIPDIVSYVQKRPKWKVSLQIHKYMQIP